ncbi:Uncharacterized protein TCM_004749 [Theobroma cacao]|uniref:Uncharacterized protein n=1 Tax=Theobroma cacao TaxID=3641 RepID=A0A061DYZ0_THECC|nr:Uncharacterized protein TCM_004749 [Theobroma cacao]
MVGSTLYIYRLLLMAKTRRKEKKPSRVVQWSPPSVRWMKFNGDGAARGCPVAAGIGGTKLAGLVVRFVQFVLVFEVCAVVCVYYLVLDLQVYVHMQEEIALILQKACGAGFCHVFLRLVVVYPKCSVRLLYHYAGCGCGRMTVFVSLCLLMSGHILTEWMSSYGFEIF